MCAAIQLRKLGITVDLVEQSADWAPDGAGITISGPSLRALRSIGVVDEVLQRGGNWTQVDICAADGALLNSVPLKHAHGAEDLPPAGGIMRPVLADILARATRAAGTQVRLGTTFETITQDGEGVDVLLSDGMNVTKSRYDLVIGADGVNSRVRGGVMPEFAGPTFSGQGSWRAVVPRTRRNSTIFMGKTTKAGLNPVSETESYLFTLDQRDKPDFIPPEQWPALLADLLVEFGGVVGDAREGLRNGSIPHQRIVYRPLAGHMLGAPWHRGRVVLLGDAVHATTPHLASGAGIAIEAAIVLAEELARCDSVEQALSAYAARHHDRAQWVVSASLQMGKIEQTGGSKEEHLQIMAQAMEALRAPI
jgi:2-polyprenyl-6-methoxyphenol hydroxylase-like FAD-dependent oxidoreductase